MISVAQFLAGATLKVISKGPRHCKTRGSKNGPFLWPPIYQLRRYS